MLNLMFSICLCASAAGSEDRPCVLIVVGAPGKPEYGTEFRRGPTSGRAAAAKAGAECIAIGSSDEPGMTDRDRLQAALAETERRPCASRSGSS